MTKGDELKYLLAPLLALALSGCSSSPSIEEELDELESRVKLIEYQNCLEVQRAYWQSRTTDGDKIEEYSLNNCSSKRP